jgi:long-chain fatty acid transport protein
MKKLNVGLAATRYAWSDYTPPYMESDLLGGVPIEVEKFKDIWVPRVGVEYDLLSFLKLRGGYFFRPSAVPDQVHATTVIDLDTHALSVGAGLKISDSISAGIHGQYRMLVERTMVKEGGASSVTASGNVWNLGLTLSFYGD